MNASLPLKPPAWRSMLRIQFRATAWALRTDLLYGAALLLTMAVMLDFAVIRGGGIDVDAANIALQLTLIGLFAPMTIWKNDEPSRRAYHWAMPVGRGSHTLAKVLGGWSWMLVLAGAYMLILVTVALLTGGDFVTGGNLEKMLMEQHGPEYNSRDVTFHGHSWLWLVPFVSITLAYLFGSIVAVSSDHPWRAYGAVMFVIVLLVAATVGGGNLQGGPLVLFKHAIVTGRYSLATAMTGSVRGELDSTIWVTAAAIWLVVAATGVSLASHHRKER